MALADDIIGFVIITLVILIAAILITNKTVTRGTDIIEDRNREFMENYYSSTLDTFLHHDENISGLPYNILIGNFMSNGNRLFLVENKTVDIQIASEKILDELYGNGMYYAKIRRSISHLFVSFVFDGSNSLSDERLEAANNMDYIIGSINELFTDEETKINSYVYILSEKDTAEICSIFPSRGNFECEALSFDMTYSSDFVGPPTFGFDTFQGWVNSDPYVRTRKKLFFEGDWVAGMAYANERYVDNAADLDNTLHMIIPVSDELSASSVADICFNQDEGANYNICALCDNECPVERSETYLEDVTDFMINTSTIVIPVFSFQCSFPYHAGWNDFIQTDFNSQYGVFPTAPRGTTVCDEPNCLGCESGVDYNSFCFHRNCNDDIKAQMNYTANATLGGLVDITDITELPTKILEKINATLEKFSIEIGVLDTERTRYVFEREVLLPNYLSKNFNLWVYEELFEDEDPPIISNVTVVPSKGRNGTIFTISAIVIDNSSVEVMAEIPLFNLSIVQVPLTEYEYNKYYGLLNSTDFEEGIYFVSIEAIDFRGNIARLNDAASFEIDDSDLEAPIIISTSVDPLSIGIGESVTINATVTDDLGINFVTVEVTYPSGEIEVYTMTLTGFIDDTYYFEFIFDDTMEVGRYILSYYAEDFGANSDSRDGDFFRVVDECAPDTICENPWPAHEGSFVTMNEPLYSCDAIEVCSDELDFVVDEAVSCCEENDCSGNKCNSGLCSRSRSTSGVDTTETETNILKCKTYYVIDGLGGYRQFKMQRYFSEEICCIRDHYCLLIGCSQNDLGRCACQTEFTSLPGFTCKAFTSQFPRGWASDTDMLQNSCMASDLPPHVSINYIGSGTCADYSIVLTTFLRKVGLGVNEVYSVIGPGHAFNLVKFPGEERWNLVDTTGNNPDPYTLGGLPRSNYRDYCSYDNCFNDNGIQACPPRANVKGC